jgi:hypothetical protein
MVDLEQDLLITICGKIETLRFSVAIQFIDKNIPEMRLSPIVCVLNSTLA